MIPFDFDYYRPDSMEKAYECYQSLSQMNKRPMYYGGGTEIISMARVKSIEFDAVIDLKAIPQCNTLEINNGYFVMGAAQTLTNIAEFNAFPLLSKTVKRIADHTIQDKLTIGGNLAGTIKYREASLPLMISNCKLQVMTVKGITEIPFNKLFDGRLQLESGDFLVAILIDQNQLNCPYSHVKKTRNEKIDYPLISMAAMKDGSTLKAAITGYGEKPCLIPEKILNHKSYSIDQKIKKIITQLHSECKSDLSGSLEYREFVLQNILQELLEHFRSTDFILK